MPSFDDDYFALGKSGDSPQPDSSVERPQVKSLMLLLLLLLLHSRVGPRDHWMKMKSLICFKIDITRKLWFLS